MLALKSLAKYLLSQKHHPVNAFVIYFAFFDVYCVYLEGKIKRYGYEEGFHNTSSGNDSISISAFHCCQG
jgi:hypothetical protein